jgi:hypothetical protein
MEEDTFIFGISVGGFTLGMEVVYAYILEFARITATAECPD